MEELFPGLKEHECVDLIDKYENGMDWSLTIPEIMQELIIIGYNQAKEDIEKKLKEINVLAIHFEDKIP